MNTIFCAPQGYYVVLDYAKDRVWHIYPPDSAILTDYSPEIVEDDLAEAPDFSEVPACALPIEVQRTIKGVSHE